MIDYDATTAALHGRWLVEASAGTGKTWTLSWLFLRLVAERGLPVEQIAVVTYTNAAAAELRDRLRQRLVDGLALLDADPDTLPPAEAAVRARWSPDADAVRDRLSAAVADFDRAVVATIHAFCLRALRDQAFEVGDGFAVELEATAASLAGDVAHDLWTSALAEAPPGFAAWMNASTWRRGEALDVVAAAIGAVRAQLVPDQRTGADPAAAELTWTDTLASFRAAWASGAREAALGVAGKNLNGTKYNPKHIPGRVEKIDAWLAGPHPAPSDALERCVSFGSEALTAAQKSPAPLPGPHAEVDTLLAAASEVGRVWAGARRDILLDLADSASAAVDRSRPTSTTVFFDDVLRRLYEALRGPAGEPLAKHLAATFPAVLVDEFQDTDPIQDEIFDRIHPDEAGFLVLVGDPKQAIYAFRGADLHTYQAAARRLGSRARSLATNFRSDAALLESIARLYQECPDPFAGAGVHFEPVRAHHGLRVGGPKRAPPLELLVVDKDEVIDAVADHVVATLGAGVTLSGRGLTPGDCAVLVGSHNVGRRIAAALSRRGVPTVRLASRSVLRTEEALVVATLLEALLAPSRVDRCKAVLASPLGGLTAERIAALDEDPAELQRRVADQLGWRDLWFGRGVQAMFRAVLRGLGATPRLLATPGGERALANLRHTAELLHVAEQTDRLGPVELLRWLDATIADPADGDESRQVRLESDDAALRVLTVHTSKGLQYPVTWIVGLGAGRPMTGLPSFHDAEGRRAVALEVDEEATEAAKLEQRQERLRLAYVGLTRARHLCYPVLERPSRGQPAGPLAELFGAVDKGDDAAGLARALAARWPDGAVVTRAIEAAASAPRYAAPAASRAALRDPPTPQRRLRHDQRITSFTGLVNAAPDEAADTDARAVHRAAIDPDAPSPLPLAAFPRGAEAGTLVHGVLEHADFAAVDEGKVREALTVAGFDAARWSETLTLGLDAALRTPIEADGFRLADLPRGDRADELDFVLPAGTAAAPLRGEDLAADLRARGDATLASAYARRLQRVRGDLVDAALKGFIDLVYRRGGRWFVVDYKTNHLGVAADDYGPTGLLGAMVEGDYLLQGTLYALAVHRMLSNRLRGYDYDEHFGGVRYLFLRGMRPETGVDRGVFAWRPSRAWIEAWDARLRGEQP